MLGIETGYLAEGCEITFYPTPAGSMVNTSKEVITFRGEVVASTRYDRFSDKEIQSTVISVRLFLAAEKLLEKMGLTLPDGVDSERYNIPKVGTLRVSIGSTMWVKTKGGRSFDSDGELHFTSGGGHIHKKSYPLPDVWIEDRFGHFGRMDAQKALKLLGDAFLTFKRA